MSKSLNNFITAGDLIDKYEPNVIRWYLLTRHYRSPIDFAYNFFDEVKIHFERMYDAIEMARVLYYNSENKIVTDNLKNEVDDFVDKFHSSMCDDFDTPGALVQINELVKLLNKCIQSGEYSSLDYIINRIVDLCSILGITIVFKDDKSYLDSLRGLLEKHNIKINNLNDAVNKLLNMRDEFRSKKDYASSDEIRDSLKKAKIFVEDFKGKSIWRRG